MKVVSDMRELLHNKNFKKLLIKWLFIYSGVMGLFAIVVTYSRYVSSQISTTSARAAKFDVDIRQEGSCSDMVNITPKTVACFDQDYNEDEEGLRAKPQVGFYFTVDTSNLEVNSKILLTATIKKQEENYFNNFKLYDVTTLKEKQELLVEENNSLLLQKTENENNIVLEYINDYHVTDQKKHTYLLILDYDYDRYKFNPLYLNKGQISIGYSAIQID